MDGSFRAFRECFSFVWDIFLWLLMYHDTVFLTFAAQHQGSCRFIQKYLWVLGPHQRLLYSLDQCRNKSLAWISCLYRSCSKGIKNYAAFKCVVSSSICNIGYLRYTWTRYTMALKLVIPAQAVRRYFSGLFHIFLHHLLVETMHLGFWGVFGLKAWILDILTKLIICMAYDWANCICRLPKFFLRKNDCNYDFLQYMLVFSLSY